MIIRVTRTIDFLIGIDCQSLDFDEPHNYLMENLKAFIEEMLKNEKEGNQTTIEIECFEEHN